MSSLHFSILPLFMVFDKDILWAPDVNYHPVKTSESLKIMNSIKDKQYAIDIDTGMTVYLYSLQDANENDIHNRLLSVNPVRHSNKEKLKIHTHNETSIKTVDKDTISYIYLRMEVSIHVQFLMSTLILLNCSVDIILLLKRQPQSLSVPLD